MKYRYVIIKGSKNDNFCRLCDSAEVIRLEKDSIPDLTESYILNDLLRVKQTPETYVYYDVFIEIVWRNKNMSEAIIERINKFDLTDTKDYGIQEVREINEGIAKFRENQKIKELNCELCNLGYNNELYPDIANFMASKKVFSTKSSQFPKLMAEFVNDLHSKMICPLVTKDKAAKIKS